MEVKKWAIRTKNFGRFMKRMMGIVGIVERNSPSRITRSMASEVLGKLITATLYPKVGLTISEIWFHHALNAIEAKVIAEEHAEDKSNFT